MTDSIKPPGAPGAPAAGPAAPAAADGRFRAELDQAEAARPPEAASALGAIAAEVKSGALTPEAAIARLLERHLATGPAQALSPVARAELERLLRSKLEDDPTMRALADDLGRARP